MTKHIFINNEPKELMSIRKYLKNRHNEIYDYIYTGGMDEDGIKKAFPTLVEKVPEFHKLNGYPIGVTRLGEIICVERPEEAYSFFFTGQTGYGKTISLHRLIDGIYNRWKYNLICLNDYQPETMSWSVRQSSRDFIKKIALTTLENPMPLPVVHIVPSLKGEIPRIANTTKINYKINFQDIINNIELFFDEKRLGGSKNYFGNINFKGCRSLEEVRKRIENYFKDNKKRRDVIFKLENLIGLLINEGITNFDKTIISNVAVRKKGAGVSGRPKLGEVPVSEINRGNLLSMLLECRLIPILVTSTLIQKIDFYAPYIEFHIREIVKYQNSKDQNLKNILYVYMDELNEILNKRNSEAVLESVKMLVRGGRFKNLGLIGAAQNINEIDEDIISNTEYLFVFRAIGEKDLSVIKKRSHLDRVEIDRIKHLKKFEFFASCGEKGNFIVYDVIGNNNYKTKKVWGMIIPPLSHHSEAGKTASSYFDSIDNLRKIGYARQLLSQNNLVLENLESPDQEHSIFEFGADKKQNYSLEEPKLIKGVNLRKIYYKDIERTRPIGYDELKEIYGLMIYFADGIYYLDKAGKWEGYGRPETKQPNDVKLILFDEEKRRARLWGENNTDEEWFNLMEN